MTHKLLTHPMVILAGALALAMLMILNQKSEAPAPEYMTWLMI